MAFFFFDQEMREREIMQAYAAYATQAKWPCNWVRDSAGQIMWAEWQRMIFSDQRNWDSLDFEKPFYP